MVIEIDNELLITLVEQRPVLWDKTTDEYKNRNKTFEGWKEICRILKDDFDEIDEKEQNDIGKYVMKRWTNIKDSFLKCLKKCNEMSRSGAAANRLKKYVYHDQLLFLKKVAVPKETEDSFNSITSGTEEVEETVNLSAPKRKTSKVDEVGILQGTKRKIQHKMSAFEERVIAAFETPPMPSGGFQDRHMAFFAGIVPSLSNLSEEQICEFQIGVLRLIQSLKRTHVTIPAHNMYLANDPSYSVRPYSYTQQATPTLVPFQPSQLPPLNVATQNFDAPCTIVRPPSAHTSGTSCIISASEDSHNILSPSYSTVSSEESQHTMHLFE